MPVVIPRILALETEGAIDYDKKGSEDISVDVLVDKLMGLVPSRPLSGDFLENGSRLYKESVGHHPEYAAPESDNIRDAVIYDKAGDRIIYTLCDRLEQELKKEGHNGSVRFFKANYQGNETWGSHENYLLSRRVDFNRFVELAIPFFVTRVIFSGAGKPKSLANGKYELSVRADHIMQKVGSATTSNRNIINTRDESHSDNTEFRRYHHIAGESNMCEYATALKLGTTSIVLSLIEDGLCPEINMPNPVKALHRISKDWRLEDKTPIEIQRDFFKAAEKHYTNIGKQLGDPFLETIMEWWDYTLMWLGKEPEILRGKIDGITKKFLIEEKMKRDGKSWDDIAFKIDRTYHRIYPEGYYSHLVRQNRNGRMYIYRVCTDEEIEQAITNPPITTRAAVRGRIIKDSIARREKINVNWSYVTIENKTIRMDDPRSTDYVIQENPIIQPVNLNTISY